jgi:serine/threonine protein kinase/WD40 repeat protein
MINPTQTDWSRFHQVREDLRGLPSTEVSTRIEQLRRDGESAAVISLLEQHCRPAQPPELSPGRRLANRYTIKEKLGEGGMGVVYEAVQELTQQEVALKVIHPARISPSLIKRFREEIRTLGKLQHDHIVRVFDADYDRNDPPNPDLLFYAMQLVQGLPLIRWVNQSHPTVDARLECFNQICEAVDYAHRHGVVHRDLKPDNILVDAGGRPAILDFGLAQIMDLAFDAPKGPLTSEGQTVLHVSGTPAFMSPERWEGDPGGVPADVFALGVLLHETLTGSQPWRVAPNASIAELRRAICNFSTDQLKEHPALSRPLARLVGSMLAPDPAARPASAAAVASALRTIAARRRLKRRIRRTAPIWAGIAVAVGSLIATQSHYARVKRQERESVLRLVQASQIVRQRSQVDTLVRVIKLLPGKPQLRHSQDQWRDVVLEALAAWNLDTRQAVPLPSGFEPIACNQQGTCFFGRATAGSWEVIERPDGAWVPKQFPGQHDFVRTRINPRQPQLAALTPASGLLIWQWNQNQQTNLLPAAETATQFEFSPDGHYLACSTTIPGPQGAGSEHLSAVRVFDTETWKAVALLFKPGDQPEPGTFIYVRSRPIAGLAFSPEGNRLAAWSHESSYLLIWQWSNEQLVQFARHPDRLAAAAWRPAPAQAELATIQANGQILVWKLPPASRPGAYLDPGDAVGWGTAALNFQGQLAWTPGGEALAAVDEMNQTMRIFAPDAGAGHLLVRLGDSSSGGMRWLSSGLVRSGESRREWVPFDSAPPVRRILRIPDFSPGCLAFNPAGTILAAADNTRIVFVATTSGAMLGSLEMPLSGPIAFDGTTGDLWAYNKTNGPISWTTAEAQNVLTCVPGAKGVSQSHVGQLAASGGHLVFSRGTDIFVVRKDGAFDSAGASPDVAVEASPQQLAISADGRRVAAIWLDPLRASLWRWQKGVGWVPELVITNAMVLANLPKWNRETPLTIRPVQQRTAEENALSSRPTHFGDPIVLTPAAQVPMVAWLRDPGLGVHLDYLGPDSCIHVATLPFDPQPGLHTAIVLSPNGMRLAAVNSSGEIHLWDLRRALLRLAELQLGIEEIKLERGGQSEESPKSLAIAGPG